MAVLSIHIPTEVDPDGLVIAYGLYGRGLEMSVLRGRPGVRTYSLDLGGRGVGHVSRVKLLLHRPGWRVAVAECAGEALSEGPEVAPRFEPLRTTRLAGRLLAKRGTPLPGETILFRYYLEEAMQYFGYADGSVTRVVMASATTADDGAFTAELPVLSEDPFFTAPDARTGSDVPGFGSFAIETRAKDGRRDGAWLPAQIPVADAYPELVLIRHA